jgi:RNA polymerase sigma-70 factor (sigma-E family)
MDDADLEFREFFVSQYGRLCWLGLLLTGDRAQAEDLAQEALLRTYWMWSRVRSYDRPGDYARKVLVNRHRSLLRRALLEARHARRTRVEEGYLPDHGEDRMVLWAAMQRLPARQRAVLVLRYHEDLSEATVARLLRLPLGTVKTLARRGLAKLRAELASPAQDRVRSGREG